MAVQLFKADRSTRLRKEVSAPRRPRFEPWPRRAVALALLVVPLLTASYLIDTHVRPLAQENGPLENFQAICMALGLVFFAITIRQAGRVGVRVMCGGLALFYATIVLLEVDLRDTDLTALNRLTNGPIRDVGLLLCWLTGGWFFLRHRRETWRTFASWLRQPAGVLLMLSGIFWVAASVTDKAWLGPRNLFVEEWLEVGAAFLMLHAAGETWIWNRALSSHAGL